ncbi:MAG TPA: hypothetical protein QF528_01110, partial [Phycisphaerales bacterium]|nr:hypothetical protein [Phycisphaerales bacterium]
MFTIFAIALTLTITPETTPEITPEITPDLAPAEVDARPSFGTGMGRSDDGLPPFENVSEGHDIVISTVDGKSGMYTLYRDEDDHLLIEVSPDYEGKPILIAYTVSSGIGESGVQLGDVYGYWTRIKDQLVLVQPNLEIKSTGDEQSQ